VQQGFVEILDFLLDEGFEDERHGLECKEGKAKGYLAYHT
jgi:hypothetical protein